MSELKHKILEQIKNEKITPKPRWVFSTIRTLVWSSIVFSMIIGSISIAIITFAITDTDWDMYTQMHKSFLEYVIFLLPYFWIVGMIVFAILGYFAFQKTAGGYRMMPYLIVFGGFIISLVCGLMLYSLGFGEALHEIFAKRIPFYDHVVFMKRDIWSRPQDGMISGKIKLIPATSTFILLNWQNNSWIITTNGSTTLLGKTTIQDGDMVKIIGEKINTTTFSAHEIRPWQRPPGFQRPPLEQHPFSCETNDECVRIIK